MYTTTRYASMRAYISGTRLRHYACSERTWCLHAGLVRLWLSASKGLTSVLEGGSYAPFEPPWLRAWICNQVQCMICCGPCTQSICTQLHAWQRCCRLTDQGALVQLRSLLLWIHTYHIRSSRVVRKCMP